MRCYKHCYGWQTNKVRVWIGCFHCGSRKCHENHAGENVVTNWEWTPIAGEKTEQTHAVHRVHCWRKQKNKVAA